MDTADCFAEYLLLIPVFMIRTRIDMIGRGFTNADTGVTR